MTSAARDVCKYQGTERTKHLAIVIPLTALFTEDESDGYMSIPATIIIRNGALTASHLKNQAVIVEGLIGERIVVDGALLLRFEQDKDNTD